MTHADWQPFLEQYSKRFLAHDWSDTLRLFARNGAVISDDARRTGWMGFEPASETAIRVAESRLGRRLPPSLRSFYAVSNGWGMVARAIFGVLPVDQVGWLCDRDPHLHRMACETEAHDRPFKRDPDGDRHRKYTFDEGTRVKRSLAISSGGDAATWLLDPGEPSGAADAEWPAGCWASWIPGMEWQADSFAGLMRHYLQRLA